MRVDDGPNICLRLGGGEHYELSESVEDPVSSPSISGVSVSAVKARELHPYAPTWRKSCSILFTGDGARGGGECF